MQHGWVYVMVNDSMRNLVKVGRTTREPRLRVAELSSATAVPTPFVLEFGQVYEDCARAERQIHAMLDERGLRVSANREFFHGPAREIVRIIMDHASQEPLIRVPRMLHEDLGTRAALGHHFCYSEIACLHAASGQARECLLMWDLFFEAYEAPPSGEAEHVLQHDPRTIRACRRYVACCLMFGAVPAYRALLLQVADDMLEQQGPDLGRWREDAAAPAVTAAIRWIFENLTPHQPGGGYRPGAGRAARRHAGTAAA